MNILLHLGHGDTVGVSGNVHIHSMVANAAQGLNTLPKLICHTFWGPSEVASILVSFNAAVDSKTSLMVIQKFNYLRAQLQGDMSRVVSNIAEREIQLIFTN